MVTVEIYTRDLCGYCTQAKRLLEAKGVDLVEHNATRDPSQRETMMKRSGKRTFPQIFVGERHVGGCDDLMALERSGKLDAALAGEVRR
ncbi:glutaredoxin 3 [Acuticoccus sp.]|uniref:glutaredoxin 3 n=1 Tax=Acuticoccus sp. TaxID=1904378 RepID=UPI003B52D432